MLEDFRNTQNNAYNLLVNAIRNNKLSHAYLIDGNNYDYAFDFIMAFVKEIVCDNCVDKENICKRIDDGNYTEVKIVEADGLVIKKDQLLDLQSSFSRTGIEGNKRIYVIRDCEKMNKQASNSLLKFLEEPDNDVVAILFTNNVSGLLSTIVSRCQLIKLNNVKEEYYDKAINNFAYSLCDKNSDIDELLLDNTINFIRYYEKNGLDTFIYLKKLWYNNFPSREDSMKVMLLLVNFYYDILKKTCGFSNYYFNDYLDLIDFVSNNNSLDDIINKIEVCYTKYDDLRYNLNVNLLVDDMLIRLGECYEYSRS